MMYRVYINNDYIISIAHGVTDGSIDENAYLFLKNVIKNKPVPQEGYDYRLKSNLMWEQYKLPPVIDEE